VIDRRGARTSRSAIGFFVAFGWSICAITLTACTPESLEFADWTIPVPEGTPIIEYEAVPMEDRTERIELVEDLAIAQRGDDPNYILYRPGHVVADSLGRIFVLDRGNYRIQVYDSEGEYLMTLGQQGQGPGEFSMMNGLALAGDRLVAVDNRNARYTVFGAAGDLLATFSKDRMTGSVSTLMGLDSGSVIAMRYLPPTEEELSGPMISRLGLLRLSEEMAPLNEVIRFPVFREPMVSRGSGTNAFPMMAMSVSLPYPEHQAVAAAGGEMYATLTSEYQVFSFSANGQMIWALRVPWRRAPIAEEEIEAEVAAIRSTPTWADFVRSEYDWPELRPAIDRIAVDGDGNVYITIYPGPGEDESEQRMVDVYSPEGEHLFSGWISSVYWRSARGDYVYTLESDGQTGDERVVRYRLVEPF